MVGSSNEQVQATAAIVRVGTSSSWSPSYLLGRNVGPFRARPGKQKSGSDCPSLEEIVMGKKLYVGNLSYNVDSSELEQLFGAHGTVQSAEVISDRMTGLS